MTPLLFFAPPGFLNADQTSTLYGVPRFSKDAGQWLVDWIDPALGCCEGTTVPTARQLAWIKTNPEEVGRVWEQFTAWLAAWDDIPF